MRQELAAIYCQTGFRSYVDMMLDVDYTMPSASGV